MKRQLFSLAAFASFVVTLGAAEPKPLRALLVLGGCCHDYTRQLDILKTGLEARAHVVVEASFSPDRSTKARYDAYEKPDWAKGYDVIIHDECSSDVKDADYVKAILAAHRAGIPAVNLHCAMHSYRVGQFREPVEPGSADALWFDFIGIQSTGHGPQLPIAITFVDKTHPITKGLENWTTIKEELYNNVQLFKTSHALARGKQLVKQRDGTEKEVEYVVAWLNDYHGTRVFNTTIGHNNETVSDPRCMELYTRGLLWACDKLNDTYLKPAPKKTVVVK
jgi:type 1 glutamine amidotransferase